MSHQMVVSALNQGEFFIYSHLQQSLVIPIIWGGLLCAVNIPALASDNSLLPMTNMARCTKCHDENTSPVLPLLKSKHAVVADKRTPFAGEACQTCHGLSEEHMKGSEDGGPRPSPSVRFGSKSNTPLSTQNESCLACHRSGLRMEWKGSPHEMKGVGCISCHTLHTGSDKVLDKKNQAEVCFTCHKTQRAESHKLSSHPIQEGKVVCSSCHNPHGAVGPKLLSTNTVNETCYTCHAEKRGPFLWEHAPVSENCITCHTPHGSIHKPLLKSRGPWLCQQCHLTSNHHTSGAYNCSSCHSTRRLSGKDCLNCHSEVHGSNHPSGARLMR
ncbi:MAG: DmsE family decaheme c-type cytochrome [Gammaproteobacteria bacterium]|nr:DmsE family decaheme c-type cytochrome [Gammaproteobacteria bacterium]